MKYPACNMTNTASNIYQKLYLAMKYIIILPIGIDKSPQEFVGNKIDQYIYIYIYIMIYNFLSYNLYNPIYNS